MATVAHDGVWAPARRPLTAGLVLAVTLVAVEALAVGAALPLVKDDLGGLGLYGWTFSAFQLGSLVGIVVAGRAADRRGARYPLAAGLGLFAVGLVAAGLAPSMLVLVGARVLQGLGGGAVPAVAYVSIGRRYPDALRPRMFALLSTAWVVPGLTGPSLGALVAEGPGWRWVFLGLLPLVGLAGALTLPALANTGAIGSEAEGADERPASLPDALRVAVGASLVLGGVNADELLPGLLLIPLGLALGLPALRRLVPAGTLRAVPGLPATVLVRGVLTFSFFGTDAFVPLGLTSVRGSGTLLAGATLTGATLGWTTGSWVQAQTVPRLGARPLVRRGFALLLVGIVATSFVLLGPVPPVLAVVTWALGGLGIGLAYSSLSLTVLREAAPGLEGEASSALQLLDVLGIALGTGAAGALVDFADVSGRSPGTGIGSAWALMGLVAVIGLWLSRRLPGPVAVPAVTTT
ncbi:MAG: MFS transporter [Acidimicrobiia bacterium]|nr:MFS transporter [Acidimicrobiia bacterium]